MPRRLRRGLPQFLQQQRLGHDHALQLDEIEALVGGVDLGALVAGALDDELGVRGDPLQGRQQRDGAAGACHLGRALESLR